MEPIDGISDERTAKYLLVYQASHEDAPWWAFMVDKSIGHVEVWWEIGGGYYTAVRPYHHYLVVDIMQGPPTGTVQEVLATRASDFPMFPAGLKTCVSIAKAMLGIRSIRVLTPRQLFNYIEQRDGIV